MSAERRYSEDEVTAIFERAANTQQTARRQLPPGQGMTLGDLQDIGREVGIPAELVAQAARSVDREGPPVRQRFFGLPIGVGRTVDLGRRLTDEEWERLVVDLRETFDARGTVRYDGPFREWTNGNLQALLEPTEDGHRLRLRTVKGEARSLIGAGSFMLGLSGALAAALALAGRLGDAGELGAPLMIAMIGLGLLGAGGLRLPRWARLRERQMEGIAARAALSAGAPSQPPDRSEGGDATPRI